MYKLFTQCRKQRGATLVYLAIGILPMIAMLGLVIDYGAAASCANKMQKAVDAAALGGASFLPNSVAKNKASELAELNYGIHDDCSVTITNNETITVTMEKAVVTRFMRVFGHETIPVGVKATAIRPKPVGKIKGHLMPFCMLNPNTNDDPADDLVPSNWGKEYILCYGEDNMIVQDWADGDGESPFNGDYESDGPAGGGNASPFEGWRGALDFDSNGTLDGAGAADFEANFLNDWPGITEVDAILPIETGNMSKPTNDARDDRLQSEEDSLFANYDPRLDYGDGRVVYMPIVSLVHQGTSDRFSLDDYNNGLIHDEESVIIDGFAPFWIYSTSEMAGFDGDNNSSNDGDWIVGRFIPGTRMENAEAGDDYSGAMTPPRLID